MFDNVSKSANIDLRKEFDVLQNSFSIDILYIRTSKYIKCNCYNPLHKVGDPTCKKCLGRGYMNTIEKVKPISTSVNYMQDMMLNTGLGVISTSDEIYYFSHKVMPKKGDLILVTKFNSKKEPVEAVSVYELHSANPVRGDHGRVEIYTCLCKLREDKLNDVNIILKSLDKIAKIYISKGKRYPCLIKQK